jgi:hypothetical protein
LISGATWTSPGFGTLLWLAGAILFVRRALADGDLGVAWRDFVVARIWETRATTSMFVGAATVAVSLLLDWKSSIDTVADADVYEHSTDRYYGFWTGWVNSTSDGGTSLASLGYAWFPELLLVALLAWLASRSAAARWRSYPLLASAALGIFAIAMALRNHAFVASEMGNTLHTSTADVIVNPGPAFGPYLALVGAVVLAFGALGARRS